MHDHDLMILTNQITLRKCVVGCKDYYVELQKEEDMNFCTSKCRKEWSNYLESYQDRTAGE